MSSATGVADYLLSSPERVAGLSLQMMSAIGHYVFGRKRIDLFIASFDKGLLHRWWTEDGGWHPTWEVRGGRWASKPAVVTSGDGRLYVFALGRNGDLHWTACQGNCDEPGSWDLQELGHPQNDRLISHPAAAFDGGSVRIFARAESGIIWTISLSTALPSYPVPRWQKLGHEGDVPPWPHAWTPIFGPTAVSWEPGRIDLFAARKIRTSGLEAPGTLDGQLMRTYRDLNRAAKSWRTPQTQSGQLLSWAARITSGPDAVAWPKTDAHPLGVLHVGGCGVTDIAGGNFVISSWLGRHWDGQRVSAPYAVSSAALAAWGHGRLDLFSVEGFPGGSISGPYRTVHRWTENLRDWTTDESSLGEYPVYFERGA